MATSSRGKSSRRYSYLVAGEHSSPVLQDSLLETGNRKTIYLFNLRRGAIVEYALEIVATKLRDLKPDESGCIAELDAGYKRARRSFKGRGARGRRVRDTVAEPLLEVANDLATDDFDGDDSGTWLESEQA